MSGWVDGLGRVRVWAVGCVDFLCNSDGGGGGDVRLTVSYGTGNRSLYFDISPCRFR